VAALEEGKSGESSECRAPLPGETGETAAGLDKTHVEAVENIRAARIGTASWSAGSRNVESDRRRVIAYLRPRFGRALNEDDFEDVAQEAWTTMLRRERRGETIRDPLAFMRSVAWRTARDMLRDRHDTAVDPSDQVLEATEDPGGSPAMRMSQRVDLARAIEAVEQLPAAERAAYRSRFLEELTTREACKRLGVARSTYHDRLRRAIESVQATLEPKRFAELERKLLGAYVAGLASRAEERRAERLIRTDPHAAAVARELQRAHEATAAALSPVVLDRGAHAGLADRLAAIPDKAREVVASVTGRGGEASDVAGSSTIGGGAGRGAGAAATGGLSKLAGLGTAGKIAAACLGTGAAATACVAAGVVPGASLVGHHDPATRPAVTRPVVQRPTPATDATLPTTPPSQAGADTRPPPNAGAPQAPEPQPETTTTTQVPPTPDPVAPSTPAGQQEFGVASAAAPASAPGSGSTGGGGGGGGSPAAREFGP
jgi:RNA polymerase sigma factor (sigma-70 family)